MSGDRLSTAQCANWLWLGHGILIAQLLVNLRRGKVRMPEQIAQMRQRYSGIEAMRGEGVSKGVWGDLGREAGVTRKPLHDQPEPLSGKSLAAVIEKECLITSRPTELAAPASDVLLQGIRRVFIDRQPSFPLSSTSALNDRLFEIHVPSIKRHHLGYSHTGGVEHVQHSAIS